MTDADKQADEIADLKREIDKLKAAQPKPYDLAGEGEWRNRMHQLREANASRHNPFTRSQLEEMERAAPTATVRAIVGRDSHGPLTYSSPGPPSNATGNVRGSSVPPGGGGTGWAKETPLGPPPGLRWVDRQLDAQDLKDKRELMEQKAKAALLDEPK